MPAKLLIVTTRWPFPVIGGDRLRIYRICEALAKEYRLTLVSLTRCKEPEAPIESKIFEQIVPVYLPRWKSILSALFGLVSRQPLQVAFYASPKMRRTVNALSQKNEILLCHLIRSAQYAKGHHSQVGVLEYTDALSLNYQRMREVRGRFSARKILYLLEHSRVARYEQNIAKQFDLLSFIAERDQRAVVAQEQNQELRTVVAGNGVALPSAVCPDKRTQTRTIAFIGNLMSLQNQMAVEFFVDKVMPALSGVKFRIVGQGQRGFLDRVSDNSCVEATGFVPDINEAVAGCEIAVCPVLVGAGVQNKILEYFALGLPVISTTVGAEGLDIQHDTHFLRADTPDEFVERINLLFTHRKVAHELAMAAFSLVKTKYSWSAQLEPLVSSVRSLDSSGASNEEDESLAD